MLLEEFSKCLIKLKHRFEAFCKRRLLLFIYLFIFSQQENWNGLLKYDDILKGVQRKVSRRPEKLEKSLEEEFVNMGRYHQETLYTCTLIKLYLKAAIIITCKGKA